MKILVMSSLMFLGQFASAASIDDLGDAQVILPKLAELDKQEIAAGKSGSRKACDKKVKDYGKMLEDQHTQHLDKVKQLASDLNVNLDQQLFAESEKAEFANQKKELSNLQVIGDCTFDRKYLNSMRSAHTFAISLVNKSLEMADDDTLKAFLQDTLPDLRAHEQKAIDLLGTARLASAE